MGWGLRGGGWRGGTSLLFRNGRGELMIWFSESLVRILCGLDRGIRVADD